MSCICRSAICYAIKLFGIVFCSLVCFCTLLQAQEKYAPPVSPRMTYNFNPGWKFIKQDAPDAEKPDFDDSKWITVSTPHTYNDEDSFDQIIARGGEAIALHGSGLLSQTLQTPGRR